MNKNWRVVSLSVCAQEYARVEAQISDLELALSLLARVAHSSDLEIRAHVVGGAREALGTVRRVLSDLKPDAEQWSRISDRAQRLGELLKASQGGEVVIPAGALH